MKRQENTEIRGKIPQNIQANHQTYLNGISN